MSRTPRTLCGPRAVRPRKLVAAAIALALSVAIFVVPPWAAGAEGASVSDHQTEILPLRTAPKLKLALNAGSGSVDTPGFPQPKALTSAIEGGLRRLPCGAREL